MLDQLSQYSQGYLFLFIFVAVGLFMGLTAFSLSFLLRPKRITSDQALTAYECGIPPEKGARIQFNVRYLIYALLFVAFDVEAVFLFPWAMQSQQFGLYAIMQVAIFIGIILVGYFYAWGRGLLKWE